MHRISLLIAVFLFTSPGLAWSSDVETLQTGKTRILEQGAFKEIFKEIIANDVSWLQGDLKINSFSSEPKQLVYTGETTGYRLLSITPERYPGKKYVSIVFTADGKDITTVKMDADVLFFGDVVIASKRIPRNTAITEEDITTAYRNVSMMDESVIQEADLVVGKMTKTTIQPGAIFYNRLVKKPPLVNRGDHVTIIARHGSLQVTAPGEVKNTGFEGDMIKVKNLMSRRVIYARVIDEGLVETDSNYASAPHLRTIGSTYTGSL